MTELTKSPGVEAGSGANYLASPAVGAYFVAKEHLAYFDAVKTARERRGRHGVLVTVLRDFLDRADTAAYPVLDGIIGRAARQRQTSSLGYLLANVRRTFPDGFGLLDISSDVTFERIRDAYRRAALRYHPDVGGTHPQMVAINAAYEALHAGLTLMGDGATTFDEAEVDRDEVQCTIDYLWVVRFSLLKVAIDDWALDEGSALLGQLTPDRCGSSRFLASDERWISITEPLTVLARRLLAADRTGDAQAALELARRGAERAARRQLNFGPLVKAVEHSIRDKRRAPSGLNHTRQIDNALRLGVIDSARHAVLLSKVAADADERATQERQLQNQLKAATFLSSLPVDPPDQGGGRTGRLVPSPDYYRVRTKDLTRDQLAEYRVAFSDSKTLELVSKYAHVRLSSLLRSFVFHPDAISPGLLAAEARELGVLAPNCGGYATGVAEVLETAARASEGQRRELAVAMRANLMPVLVTRDSAGRATSYQAGDVGGLTPGFLDEAMRLAECAAAGKPLAEVSISPEAERASEAKRKKLKAFMKAVEKRLRAGDLKAIQDAIAFHADDIDCVLGDIEGDGWLRKLVEAREYAECISTIVRVNDLLDDLIQRRRRHAIYSQGTVDGYRHDKRHFNEGLTKSMFPGRLPIDFGVGGDDLSRLLETVKGYHGLMSSGFMERVGDGCATSGRTAEARDYFRAALQAAREEGRPASAIKRLERKTSP